VTFRRLTPGHVLALVAALALLLAMVPTWWTDKQGEQFRFFQHQIAPQLNSQTVPSESAKEADAATKHEKNPWHPRGAIDGLILVSLLATAGLAIAAAFVRAGGRRGPPLSALCTVVGLVASLLVAYRILQPPGPNYAAVVRWGAPVGLLCVGLVTIGARIATRSERDAPVSDRAGPAAGADAQPTPAGSG
jgi:peptidoglycan/LPS O-acetylase OafA/YrhL